MSLAEEGVPGSGCSSRHHLPPPPTPRKGLTSEHKPEGDIGLGQQGLHVAPEELQGLAFAAAWVEQHQYEAGSWELVLGAPGCQTQTRKGRVINRPLGGAGSQQGHWGGTGCLEYRGN